VKIGVKTGVCFKSQTDPELNQKETCLRKSMQSKNKLMENCKKSARFLQGFCKLPDLVYTLDPCIEIFIKTNSNVSKHATISLLPKGEKKKAISLGFIFRP
jgi:hypothetical protein